MIKLSGSWHIPDGTSTADNDAHYFAVHVPNVRRLPKLARHVVLKSVPFPEGVHPRAWRSAEIWFDSKADFDAAMESPEWQAIVDDGFMPSVAGLIIDVFDVQEEWTPGGPPRMTPEGGGPVKLVGTWHVPDGTSTEENDRHYFGVHVPNVRRLPKLARHLVLKSVPFPEGSHPRCWRSAEIWFDSQADFDAAMLSPEWQAIADDGFMPSVAWLMIDVYSVEREWVPADA